MLGFSLGAYLAVSAAAIDSRVQAVVEFFGGLPKENCLITANANAIHYKELFVGGASSSLARQNREALEIIASRQIHAERYITHTFPLERISEAFETVERRIAIKVVIHPGERT